MKIGIVAGGPHELVPDLKGYRSRKDIIWVGVDRGAFLLNCVGIQPHYAFGDFDSVSEEEKNYIFQTDTKINVYQSEKDETDMEIAFNWALEQKPEEILLFGASGGRLDHELLNLQLLFIALTSGVKARLIDRNNSISLYNPGTYTIDNELDYPYVSFLAFRDSVTGITLVGFKYPLENRTLEYGSSLCISNELVNKSGTYSFNSGIIMMVKSRD